MSRILTDGHSTIIGFAEEANVLLEEKSVTPPGVDGGGPVDTTTMRNTRWRTQQPKQLLTLTAAGATCAYDPDVFPQLVAMVNINQIVTVTFPDLSTLAFYGWLDKATPNEHTEGEQPTLEATVEPSNMDNDGEEVDPTETPGVTTTPP